MFFFVEEWVDKIYEETYHWHSGKALDGFQSFMTEVWTLLSLLFLILGRTTTSIMLAWTSIFGNMDVLWKLLKDLQKRMSFHKTFTSKCKFKQIDLLVRCLPVRNGRPLQQVSSNIRKEMSMYNCFMVYSFTL